jgi:hypothetical protein
VRNVYYVKLKSAYNSFLRAHPAVAPTAYPQAPAENHNWPRHPIG